MPLALAPASRPFRRSTFAPLALALVLVLVFALAPAACGTTTRAHQLTTAAMLPRQVAVLPPSSTGLTADTAEQLRIAVGSVFEQRGYVKLDDGWVDQRLAAAGFQPWLPEWFPADERLVVWGLANGIDGLVLLEDFTAATLTSVVFNRR